MCYYAFVRYQCGCTPRAPILVASGLDCPTRCPERRNPQVDYSNIKHLSYNCNNCQVTRDMNGRARHEQEFRPAAITRGPSQRGGRDGAGTQTATRGPPAVEGRTKVAAAKSAEERAAAARWRQWDREMEAKEAEERREAARAAKAATKSGRK